MLCEECGKRQAVCVGYYDGSCTGIRSCAECCDHDGVCTDIENEFEFSEIEIRALRFLSRNKHRLLRPNYIGENLWPKSVKRTSNCSAPFARPAGKLLNRLREKQAVEYEYSTMSGESGWKITSFGLAQVDS